MITSKDLELFKEGKLITYNLSIPKDFKIKDLIKKIVNELNDVFYRGDVPLRFITPEGTNINFFDIRPSKKSGKPDLDLPSK